MSFISEFASDIRFIYDNVNTVAYTLSGITVHVCFIICTSYNFPGLNCAQLADLELQQLCSRSVSLIFKDYFVHHDAKTVVCDTSTGTARPYVSLLFRRAIFDVLHPLFHPGIQPCQRLVASRYIWPEMNVYHRRWAT